MFGKKGSSGAKSKPKKSVKQGPKVNFFAAHAEKLVLALVVGLLGFLVYEGFGGKTYDQSRQPNQLAEKATSISNNIKNGDPWAAIKETIKDTVPIENTSFTPKTEAARMPTDERIYGAFPMGGAGAQPFVKRGDPKLLPPVKIVGQSVIGLIAMEAPDDYVDPFEEFEDAVKLKGKSSGSSPSRGRNRAEGGSGSAAGMGDSAGGGVAGSGGMDMGMGMGGMGFGGNSSQRTFPSKYNHGFTLGGGMSGGGYGGYGGEGGMGMADMGAGSGMGSAMGSAGMPGMGGVGGAGTTGGLNGVQRPKPKKYKAEPILFNAVTALVPHEEMLKEYEAKLRESASYNAMRDTPIYLDLIYERCQVVEGKPDKWEKGGSAREQLAMIKKWLPRQPNIPEVIDLTSYDRALTMPIPPLLLQDYRKFAKHPDIDWIWDAGMNQPQTQFPTPDPGASDNSDQYLPGELPGMAGGMGMGGMGMGGSGSGMGMPGMGDMAGGGMAGSGMGMPGGSDMGMGMPGYGDMGMAGSGMAGSGGMGMPGGMGMEGSGGGMAGGMGGYGMGMGMGMMMPAKYKMIRFYDKLDINKDIGKTFKYRVKVVMEDPNYPSDRFPAPPSNDLEPEVFARVSERRAVDDPIVEQYRIENMKAMQAAQANRTTPRLKVHTRKKLETEFSEPSKGIYVRGVDDVYVNKMGKKQANPEVEAVIVRLDRQKGAYVPMYFFIEDDEAIKKQAEEKDKDAKPPKFTKVNVPPFRRGAVVAIATPLTTEFAHPITNVIKRWFNYSTFSEGWNTVIDIRGGDPLAGNKAQEDPLTDNVEMMMLMSDGRVEITNEFDDAAQYRAFTLADEREAAEKGTGAAGGAGGFPGSDGGAGASAGMSSGSR